MKRKIVQHGASTLITSLPRKWCEKYSIKRGDEINIEERGHLLEISTEKALAVRTQKLDIRKLSTSLVWRYILTLYRYGIDEIIITHDNQAELIEKITNQLIGFGIVSQEADKITLKDLSGVSESEFDVVYRRCFFLLLEIAEQTAALFEKKQSLEPVMKMDNNLNKYVDYCLRILNKRAFSDPRQTSLYYHMIMQLEIIGDFYSVIAKLKPKTLRHIKDVNAMLRKFYELCFDYSDAKAQELYDIRAKLEPKLENTQLKEIFYSTLNLIDVQYAISLEKSSK
jgi:phosphate uptake regulator